MVSSSILFISARRPSWWTLLIFCFLAVVVVETDAANHCSGSVCSGAYADVRYDPQRAYVGADGSAFIQTRIRTNSTAPRQIVPRANSTKPVALHPKLNQSIGKAAFSAEEVRAEEVKQLEQKKFTAAVAAKEVTAIDVSLSSAALLKRTGRAIWLSLSALATLLTVVILTVGYCLWSRYGAAASSSATGNSAFTVQKFSQPKALSIEEAISAVGVGRTQWVLLVLCGLTFCADAAEVTYLSFVTEVLRCQWDLSVTQEAWITSAVFLGMIVGAPLWGLIADTAGRRTAFLASSSIITLFGFATALCTNFVGLICVRAAVGVGVAGLPVGFDILAEALPASRRGGFLLYIEYFWTAGSIYVTACAFFSLQSVGWQLLTCLAAVPTLLSTIAALLLLPESPRWLVAQGRQAEAVKIMNSWAKANGSALCVSALHDEMPSSSSDRSVDGVDLSSAGSVRRSMVLMSCVWFAFGLVYYGVVLLLPRILVQSEAVGVLGACVVDFDFKHLAISCSAEVLGVAFAICTIDRLGRTTTQGFFYCLGGLMVFLLGYKSMGMATITLVASLARLAQMGASCATWVHTPELFPTNMRAEAHGMLNLASKVGAFVAPFVINGTLSSTTSTRLMATVSLTAAVAAMCLPETAGKVL